ncbi:hypothetical protein TWF694_003529 [Orbilia ellipsospora]|uniref:rRNA methyltransferase 1, mitochondrial n=1 Tax=Orbilia ellipsospora TaxID=2528407 RepID=A0AAV9WYC6_9PEZI
MYRGIAHTGLSRTSTSRSHVLPYITSYPTLQRQFSRMVLLKGGKKTKSAWQYRGTRSSREKEQRLSGIRDRQIKARSFDFEKIHRREEEEEEEEEPTILRTAEADSGFKIRWSEKAPTKDHVHPWDNERYKPTRPPRPPSPPPEEEKPTGWVSQKDTGFIEPPPSTQLPKGEELNLILETPRNEGNGLSDVRSEDPPTRTHDRPRFIAHRMGKYNPKQDGKNNMYSREDGELDRWVNEANDAELLAVGITSGASKQAPLPVSRSNTGDDGRYEKAGYSYGLQWGLTRKPPRDLPFATPTSEYLYGYSVSRLALREKRRMVHRLYVYQGLMRDRRTLEREAKLRRNAEQVGIPVTGVEDISLLDAMSKGRPHNGFVLEVEPIKIPTIDYLGSVKDRQFNAPISGSTQYVKLSSKQENRHPFVLILDQLLDGGNFGAILRSAYFLGVDAVVISANNSTPATASTSKSSAGALEVVDLYHSQNLLNFITESQTRGWKFYGAMPNPSQADLKSSKKSKATKWYDMEGLNDPLHFHPCALVMGNEAEGLRPTIQSLMDGYVTIRSSEHADDTIDSLNVGVAASILTHGFLNPSAKNKRPESAKDRKTIRKLSRLDVEKAVAENTMFTMDDGKYEAPRYEGTKLVERSGVGVDDEETTMAESTTITTADETDAKLMEENEEEGEDEDDDEDYTNSMEEEEDENHEDEDEDWLGEQMEKDGNPENDEDALKILEEQYGITFKDGKAMPFEPNEDEDEDGGLIDLDEELGDDEDIEEDSELEDSDEEDLEEDDEDSEAIDPNRKTSRGST